MRAAVYLSHALVLRQDPTTLLTTSCTQTSTSTSTVTVHVRSPDPPSPAGASPAPDPAKCVANNGTPGSVYICGALDDCEYWEYTKAKDCQVLGEKFQHPSLVGPDFGGHCHLYNATTCADAGEIKLIDNISSAPLPAPTKPSKITCPGIRKENIPEPGAKAIKCVNSLEHPTAPGGAPAGPASPPPVSLPASSPTSSPPPASPPPNALPPTPSSTCPLPEAIAPNPCLCNAAIGHPGAVYICKARAGVPATDCKWLDFPAVKDCQPLKTLGGMDFSNASFVGPDYGGHCHLYTSESCADVTEALLFLNETGQPSKKFTCPGVKLPYKPTSGQQADGKLLELWTAKAIKCVDSMTHPLAAPAAA